MTSLGFPGGAGGKEPTSHCRNTRHGFSLWVGRSLGRGMATHSIFSVWRVPWSRGPGGLWPFGSQRVRHYWSVLVCTHLLLSMLPKLWVMLPETPLCRSFLWGHNLEGVVMSCQSSLDSVAVSMKSLNTKPHYHENHVRSEIAVCNQMSPQLCDQPALAVIKLLCRYHRRCADYPQHWEICLVWTHLQCHRGNLPCLNCVTTGESAISRHLPCRRRWIYRVCGHLPCRCRLNLPCQTLTMVTVIIIGGDGWWWWGCAGEAAEPINDDGFSSILLIAEDLETECFFLNIKSCPPHRHWSGTSVAASVMKHKYTVNAESVPGSNTLKGASASLFCLVPRWLFLIGCFLLNFIVTDSESRCPFHDCEFQLCCYKGLLWTGTFLKVFEPWIGTVSHKISNYEDIVRSWILLLFPRLKVTLPLLSHGEVSVLMLFTVKNTNPISHRLFTSTMLPSHN